MNPIPILGIIGIAGLFGFVYVESDGFSQTVDNSLNSFASTIGLEGLVKFHEDCNPNTGDCISFFTVKEPEQEIHQDMDVGYGIENVTQAQYYEDGSPVSDFSYATGVVSDTSYSREGDKLLTESIGDKGQMLVQIGNIATIQGQIKILDDNGDIVEPRIYDYWIIIKCNDNNEFCNEPSFTQRDVTKSNGVFIEKWSTNNKMTEGLYDVQIYAESEQLNSLGRKYTVEGLIQIELFK